MPSIFCTSKWLNILQIRFTHIVQYQKTGVEVKSSLKPYNQQVKKRSLLFYLTEQKSFAIDIDRLSNVFLQSTSQAEGEDSS